MLGPLLPYTLAAEYLPGFHAGQYKIVGALLKEVGSGRIVAHVQQTGGLTQLLSGAMSRAGSVLSNDTNPFGLASGIIGNIQNEQMKRRLADIQQTLGGMQTLQIASLATSVIGIGVTVAATALILRRLDRIEKQIAGLEQKIDALPRLIADMHLHRTLREFRVTLTRLEDASDRRDSTPILRDAEKDLDHTFSELQHAIEILLGQSAIQGDALATLLHMLGLCSETQMKTLFRMGDTAVARNRARNHYTVIEGLTFTIPPDVLTQRLADPSRASDLTNICSVMRLNLAARPPLIDTFIARDIDPVHYLHQAESELTEPLLFLPTA